MADSPRPSKLPTVDEIARYAHLVESLPGWRRIGEILVDLRLTTTHFINEALAAQRAAQKSSGHAAGLLDILIERKVISPQQAKDALNYQIMRYFLPMLGRALTEAEHTRDELADTYRRSLSSLAAQSETIRQQDDVISGLRKEIATLKGELRNLQREMSRNQRG